MVMCVIFDATTEKRSWLAEASGYGQYFLTRIFLIMYVHQVFFYRISTTLNKLQCK